MFDVKRPSRVHTRAAGVSMRQDASRDANGAAVDQGDDTVYVTNYSSGTVSVIARVSASSGFGVRRGGEHCDGDSRCSPGGL